MTEKSGDDKKIGLEENISLFDSVTVSKSFSDKELKEIFRETVSEIMTEYLRKADRDGWKRTIIGIIASAILGAIFGIILTIMLL